ncbi:glycosyltransferase family 2 protein, partial [Vibrio sp. M260118]|uniref:glycosyltransferase family 2 protein n=1 Tax=Vibrio sp. M260118 TaxID=3020896 RepID=UPI002F3E93E3
MKNKNILISVVIPCTDRVLGLQRCLDSVLSQNVTADLELVLVENNSMNRNVITEMVETIQDERIKHHYLDVCDNANVARNYGMKNSSGDYIAYMDSDDWWNEMHLSTCLDQIKKGANAIYSGFILDNGKVQEPKYSRAIEQESPYKFLFGSSPGVAQTSSFFLSREVFDLCTWDEDLRRSQDYDFFIEVQKKVGWSYKSSLTVFVYWEQGGVRTLSVDAFEKFYAKHSGTMTPSEKAEYLCEIIKAFSLVSQRNYSRFSILLGQNRKYLGLKNRIMISNYYVTVSLLKLR